MPLVFPAPSMLAFCGILPSFVCRAAEHFFRPPAAPFSFMQAPFMFQASPGTAPSTQPPGRSPPSAPGDNVFRTLSLASAFVSTTMSPPHATSSAFSQPTPKMLPPPIGPGAQMAPDRRLKALCPPASTLVPSLPGRIQHLQLAEAR